MTDDLRAALARAHGVRAGGGDGVVGVAHRAHPARAGN